jgi:hypothetical protein
MAEMCPDSVFACSAKVDKYQNLIDRYVQGGQGMLCGSDQNCDELKCVDDVCCESDCAQPCQTCNRPGAVGFCVSELDGTSCDDDNYCNGREVCFDGTCTPGEFFICDDRNPCTEDSCDPGSLCSHQPVADETACGIEGTCRLGKCVDSSIEEHCGCATPEPQAHGFSALLLVAAILLRKRIASSG